MEGQKYWKLYAPRDEATTLPRFSSKNFSPAELDEPIFEGWLEQGDFLYFPRGFIHQGHCSDQVHSLHVTLSTGQQNSYGNFLELLFPGAINSAINANVQLRRSLPRDYLSYMGAIHSDAESDERRNSFLSEMKKQMKIVLNEALNMLDSASDQMACKFLVDRLPPVLTDQEEASTVEGSPLPKFTVNTSIRLLRQGIVRMAIEDGKAIVYHSMDNSRKHHEVPLNPLEFELDDAPCIEMILINYPNYVRVGDLPHDTDDDKVDVVKALYAEGIVAFELND